MDRVQPEGTARVLDRFAPFRVLRRQREQVVMGDRRPALPAGAGRASGGLGVRALGFAQVAKLLHQRTVAGERAHWTLALWLHCAGKKGFASKQLQRMTGLSYKSALFMAHRIRYAMSDEPATALLGTAGAVEVDETYVGGKPRKPTKRQREKAAAEGRELPKSKRGRGTKKIPVVAIVERGGRVVASPVQSVTGETLKEAIRTYVDPRARINTDELVLYRGIGAEFEGGHRTVQHSQDEYVRYDADGAVAHINSAEGFFSLLKRGIQGVYHSVSPRHLHRYVDAAAWRYSNRRSDDGERMRLLVQCCEGKRLPNRKSAAL